jgi:hypothetical protein
MKSPHHSLVNSEALVFSEWLISLVWKKDWILFHLGSLLGQQICLWLVEMEVGFLERAA